MYRLADADSLLPGDSALDLNSTRSQHWSYYKSGW